jgi:hypothetical protein
MVNRIPTHRHHGDHFTTGNQHLHQPHTHTLLPRLQTRIAALRLLARNTRQRLRDRATRTLLLIRMRLVHHPLHEECHRLEDDRLLRGLLHQLLRLILITTRLLHTIEHLFPDSLRDMVNL